MRTLHLRNVPDEVMNRLERLARAASTSVTAVAIRELDAATRRVDNASLVATLPDLEISAEAIVGSVRRRSKVIVLDASAAVSALLSNHGQARRYLADDLIHAPHLVIEVLSALRRQVNAGRLTADHAHQGDDRVKENRAHPLPATPLVDRPGNYETR